MSVAAVLRRFVALILITTLLSACGSWRGLANLPLPGGPGTGEDRLTIYVELPDALALNVNSRVRVADVFVGRVRAVELKDWIATATVDLDPTVRLPVNATATIGQTTLLGTQHLELGTPGGREEKTLSTGDTITLAASSAYPTTEQLLAAVAGILHGGGVRNLEVIQSEIHRVLTGRADQIRDFLTRLDTFTDELNRQRTDIARAIDSTDRLLAIVSRRTATLDHALTEIPPLIDHFAETRDLFSDAVTALGRLSAAADAALAPASGALNTDLTNLQRPLRQLSRASPFLLGALRIMLTTPFPCCENIPKVVRGDYVNASIVVDLTLSSIDNTLLTGTGVSGMLRALEQAWGRDPATMIPDVRFTPNPHNAPGGPLVERGE